MLPSTRPPARVFISNLGDKPLFSLRWTMKCPGCGAQMTKLTPEERYRCEMCGWTEPPRG